ncbi:MAG: AMP-binding protein [Thermofilaceae archaeon]
MAEEVLRLVYSEEALVSPSTRWKAITVEEYKAVYESSLRDLEGFWAKEASKLEWRSPWLKVREGAPPRTRWFTGGLISAYDNVLGRHRSSWVWSKPALIWEGEDYQVEVLTYADLDSLASRIAGALKAFGVGAGDWVVFYAPPVPQVLAAMLACAKLGAPFEPVFTGFGYGVLAERLAARGAKLLVTVDGFYRRGKPLNTLSVARKALERCNRGVEIVVVERVGSASLREGELSFDDLLRSAKPIDESFAGPSEHPLFGLSPGYEEGFKPLTHGTGGYLTQVFATTRWMGLRPRDTYFCTVWPGWITGVSYVVFGPLMVGSTIVAYEGGPDWPQWDRWWDIIETYAVTVFLTTGGALRLLRRRAPEAHRGRNLDTLRAILVTAEPLEVEVWEWAYRHLGTGTTPIVDSNPSKLTGRIPVVCMYVQSELGTFVTGNLLNYTFPPLVPGSVGPPIPGFHLDVVDAEGRAVRGEIGELVVRAPWPAMPVEYPEEFERAWRDGFYRTGDFALMRPDGYLFVLGRRDEVMKVSGYRLSPGALERAAESLAGVVSAVVVKARDELRFEAPFLAFQGSADPETVKRAVREIVGAIAEPQTVARFDSLGASKEEVRSRLKRILRKEAPGELLDARGRG